MRRRTPILPLALLIAFALAACGGREAAASAPGSTMGAFPPST